MPTEEQILDAVTDEHEGRGAARVLEHRLRYNCTQEERETIRKAVVTAITTGKPITDEDGNVIRYRKPGPRTLGILARVFDTFNASDQKDMHHLEGQKVNLTATINKPPDEEAAELLAEMRSRKLSGRVLPPIQASEEQ